MKKSFTSTTSVCLSSLLILSLACPSAAFQTEMPAEVAAASPLELLEAGLAGERNVPRAIYLLGKQDYDGALAAIDERAERLYPWLRPYLEGTIRAFAPLERSESEHFELYTPPGQMFLKDYALPALEKTYAHFEKALGPRSGSKIRVEIYPTKEDFSDASTLSIETLERSGAIGICKFHRLMIMSPQTLPLGYRWLDALSHEYTHLRVNELTASRAELWLHEGTARYLETAYRLDPPAFLTPDQKTKLLEAREKGTLVTFERMSPSMVYLKDQEEVSLAFSEVSYAVSTLFRDFGEKKFIGFLNSLRRAPFAAAFSKAFGMTPEQFEKRWQAGLPAEGWEKTKGTMSDEIRFEAPKEDAVMGADVKGRIRLGDRMRMRGHNEAALIEYERALVDEPDNAVILLKAARMNLVLGDPGAAVERLRRATEKNPNYGTPHIELAKLVEPKEALAHLEEANAINPFNPEIHDLMADALEKLGRGEEASREREIAASLKP